MPLRLQICLAAVQAALLLATLAPSPARAQDAQKFDGKWATTVTCKASNNPPLQFMTEVSGGVLSGQQGSEGAPGYLRIDGKITPQGVGHIYARGRAGKDEIVAGREVQAGSEYSYYIRAQFERAIGSGNRVEGRACEFKFVKK
jgi:hypothetical protein